MGRAVLAINWSIWDGERWWVLHISLSLFSCKSRSRMEGWNCIEGADWPIRRTEKEEGRHRLFVDIINHRSGVETSSLRGKRTRKEEKRKKEEEVERQGRVRPGVVNSSICKTDSPRPFPLHLLLILVTRRSSHTSFFFSPLFSPSSPSPSSLSFFILSIYLSAGTRNKFEWNRSAMPSRSARWW